MARILVVQAARFGDLVQSKRLLLSLASRDEVHLLVDNNLTTLAELLYPFVSVHGLCLHGTLTDEKFFENETVFSELQNCNFDRIYNCNFSRITAAICRLFDPTKVFGFRPAICSSGGLERSSWARLVFRLGMLRRAASLNLVDFWGWFAERPVPPHTVNPAAEPGGRGLCVALSGREARRSLPAPLLASIVESASRLMGNPEIKLLGSGMENMLARKLMHLLPRDIQSRTEDLSGKTDWAELVATMRGMDALITPDTGLMHLAAHLGVPVLAFFLSSAWAHETGPYGLGHTIWQADISCAPCLESAACNNNLACLELFKGGELFRSIAHAMGRQVKAGSFESSLLQCWQSGFDALGAKLSLVHGTDQDARQRALRRRLLAEFLCLPPEKGSNIFPETAEEIWHMEDELMPESEWMLPPGRYC